MSHIEPEDVPLPPTLRRFLGVSAAAVAAIVLVLLIGIGGYVALIFGWHPIPSTALGCSLHKRFHSFHGAPVKFENLQLAKQLSESDDQRAGADRSRRSKDRGSSCLVRLALGPLG